MKIKVSLWDNSKTRILGIESFDNVKELEEFMKTVKQVEDKASYRVMAVSK